MIFLTTLFILLLCVFMMSLGVILSNKEIKGSCGGNDTSCECTKIQKTMCAIKGTVSTNSHNH